MAFCLCVGLALLSFRHESEYIALHSTTPSSTADRAQQGASVYFGFLAPPFTPPHSVQTSQHGSSWLSVLVIFICPRQLNIFICCCRQLNTSFAFVLHALVCLTSCGTNWAVYSVTRSPLCRSGCFSSDTNRCSGQLCVSGHVSSDTDQCSGSCVLVDRFPQIQTSVVAAVC